MNEAFHFKISLIMNFFLYAEAEGSFGINNGTGRLMINYKSDKITSIIFDDTTKKITVQTNDNIWGATLVFGVPTNWVVCP